MSIAPQARVVPILTGWMVRSCPIHVLSICGGSEGCIIVPAAAKV